MGGTKIVVFQLRDLMKKGILAIIGIAVLLLLLYFFVLKDKPAAAPPAAASYLPAMYYPGTYSTEILLYNSPLEVLVTVTDEEIVSVELAPLSELHSTLYPLLEPSMDTLAEKVVKSQTVSGITPEENTETEQFLLAAIQSALLQAESDAQYYVRGGE